MFPCFFYKFSLRFMWWAVEVSWVHGLQMGPCLWRLDHRCGGCCTLPETNSSHLKIDGSRLLSVWGPAYFQGLLLFVLGRVSFSSQQFVGFRCANCCRLDVDIPYDISKILLMKSQKRGRILSIKRVEFLTNELTMFPGHPFKEDLVWATHQHPM